MQADLRPLAACFAALKQQPGATVAFRACWHRREGFDQWEMRVGDGPPARIPNGRNPLSKIAAVEQFVLVVNAVLSGFGLGTLEFVAIYEAGEPEEPNPEAMEEMRRFGSYDDRPNGKIQVGKVTYVLATKS